MLTAKLAENEVVGGGGTSKKNMERHWGFGEATSKVMKSAGKLLRWLQR